MRECGGNSSMEELDGERTIVPDIPANYVSIVQLKERWLKEKERKRKEEEDKEKRPWDWGQQVEEPGKIEGDLKKSVAVEKQEDLGEDLERNRYEEENRLGWSGKKHFGRYSKKNESTVGSEASCAEKGEAEVMAIVSEGSKDADLRDDKLPESKKKPRNQKKKPKKTKNQSVTVEDVVDFESSAPPESLWKESTPVKNQFLVYRPKRETAIGKKNVKSGEKASTDATTLEMQREDLSINRCDEKEQTRNTKEPFRSSHSRRNWPDQRQYLPLRRGRMPREAAATMVWVKKEHNEGAGSGSGVKPLTS